MVERKSPVYVVADCSGSMTGSSIVSLNEGIKTLHDNLMSEPMAMETVFLSVISFSSDAKQLVPLTDLISFTPPVLNAEGTTALGAALKLLGECIEREVKKRTNEQRGDYRPLVFLMTDGVPTDTWESYANELRQKRNAQIIGVAVGPDAKIDVLKSITDTVVVMHEMTADGFKQFFKWATQSVFQSVKTNAQQPVPPPPTGGDDWVGAPASGTGPDCGPALPPPPPAITIV